MITAPERRPPSVLKQEQTPRRDQPPPLPPRPHERGPLRLRPQPVKTSPQTPTGILADRWQQQVDGAARRLRFADQDQSPVTPRPAAATNTPGQEFHTPPEIPIKAEEEEDADTKPVGGARPKRIRKIKRDPDFEYY